MCPEPATAALRGAAEVAEVSCARSPVNLRCLGNLGKLLAPHSSRLQGSFISREWWFFMGFHMGFDGSPNGQYMANLWIIYGKYLVLLYIMWVCRNAIGTTRQIDVLFIPPIKMLHHCYINHQFDGWFMTLLYPHYLEIVPGTFLNFQPKSWPIDQQRWRRSLSFMSMSTFCFLLSLKGGLRMGSKRSLWCHQTWSAGKSPDSMEDFS